jgi:hypothetical protein
LDFPNTVLEAANRKSVLLIIRVPVDLGIISVQVAPPSVGRAILAGRPEVRVRASIVERAFVVPVAG